jgi:hypothetical protein
MIIGITGAIAVIFGIREYIKSQRWQRAQAVSSLIKEFEENARFKPAKIMLDWDERAFEMPGGGLLHFKNEVLVRALRVVKMDTESEFTKEEIFIRDSFDAFLDFLERLYSLQTNRLVKFLDLQYFWYWLDLLDRIGELKQNEAIKKVVDQFIDSYRFNGVRRLLQLYANESDGRLKLDIG